MATHRLRLIAATVVVATLLIVAVGAADDIGPLRKSEKLCLEILEVPEQYINLMNSFQYVDNRYIRVIIRCVGILQGFYTDEDGAFLDPLYQKLIVDAGCTMTKEDFDAQRSRCVSEIVRDPCIPLDDTDKCWPVYKCFEQDYMHALRVEDCKYSKQCNETVQVIELHIRPPKRYRKRG